MLDIRDVTAECVRAKYGSFGDYRAPHAAEVVAEIAALLPTKEEDANDKVFPVVMVDSVGPWTPLIAYNRSLKQSCRDENVNVGKALQ